MTTEQLRKNITVSDFGIDEKGIKIYYRNHPKPNWRSPELVLHLPPKEAAIELRAIGEIDSCDDWPNDILITIGTRAMIWEMFASKFILSQWDALNLVIRHEYKKSLEEDINLLEIDSALAAIKNNI